MELMALLGFTAGGVLVQLKPSLRAGDLDGRMAKLCLAGAASTVLGSVIRIALSWTLIDRAGSDT
jgi:hypothetical protein